MPKRSDNIHKRKDGRWEGRYRIGTSPSGKTLYKSVYGKTYSEVKEKMKSFVHAPQNETQNRRELKFCELLELWLSTNSINHKGATESKYSWMIDKHINPILGNLKLSQLSSAKINEFLNQKLTNGRLDGNGGLSRATVRSLTIIIDAAIKYAVAEQLCLPFKTPICKPIQEKKQIKILSKTDQTILESKICNNISLTGLGILISLHTGLRIGEVCALQWKDIDFNKNIILVRHTITRVNSSETNRKTTLILDKPKTKTSFREIPINSFLFQVLKDAKSSTNAPFVVSESSNFISPRTFEYRYHCMLKHCGIDRINFHALRHTFATRCIECGCDYKSLSELLGHSNVKITLDTYVHSSIELKRAEIEKLVC